MKNGYFHLFLFYLQSCPDEVSSRDAYQHALQRKIVLAQSKAEREIAVSKLDEYNKVFHPLLGLRYLNKFVLPISAKKCDCEPILFAY